ncbi:MAG TPA: preprotein translocase subunit SecG [Burkholderiales bacterium]|nr:preprotein translocase subunit SecG [Burkholderiales bacterium]
MVWTNIIIVVHVLVALAIIGLVLLQHGKGADMGSGFGGGASSSLFGATGSANFLSRATAALATVFFILSLVLAYLATTQPRDSGSVVDRVRPKPAAEKQADKPAAAPEEKKDDKSGKPAGVPQVPQ